MFLLKSGREKISKQEYSYGRRAQSTVRTLQWSQVAVIKTDDPVLAVGEAVQALTEWAQMDARYVRESIWQVEGIGPNAGFVKLICDNSDRQVSESKG